MLSSFSLCIVPIISSRLAAPSRVSLPFLSKQNAVPNNIKSRYLGYCFVVNLSFLTGLKNQEDGHKILLEQYTDRLDLSFNVLSQ